MYGAIIGDIVGSVYEFRNIKTKDFPFVTHKNFFTDDTLMTVAIASALLMHKLSGMDLHEAAIYEMRRFGDLFPSAGYGGMFEYWLVKDDPSPYNSFGNGSAMRVSPCGLIATTLDEALELAKVSAEVTHNHPEGIKGAQAVAAAIFLAKSGSTKDEIKNYIKNNFYKLDKTIDEIRPDYKFNETCQGSVPQAIQAFLESTDFEDAIRNAISIGGDSDTIGAITGSIAWSFYKDRMSEDEKNAMLDIVNLPASLMKVVKRFDKYMEDVNGN